MKDYSPADASRGDQEIRCKIMESSKTITVYPKNDWAKPGSQHVNKP